MEKGTRKKRPQKQKTDDNKMAEVGPYINNNINVMDKTLNKKDIQYVNS